MSIEKVWKLRVTIWSKQYQQEQRFLCDKKVKYLTIKCSLQRTTNNYSIKYVKLKFSKKIIKFVDAKNLQKNALFQLIILLTFYGKCQICKLGINIQKENKRKKYCKNRRNKYIINKSCRKKDNKK